MAKYKFTNEHRKKISDAHKGKILSEVHKRKIELSSKKIKHTKDWNKKISITKLQKIKSGEYNNMRKDISKRMKGKNNPAKKISVRRKISETLKRKYISGEKKRLIGKLHPNWNNGSSFEPYSVDWTKTLRRAIKERDIFKCKICKSDDFLVVHHIDYNKKNCNPDNLITLCRTCHNKTNYNRKYWLEIFI